MGIMTQEVGRVHSILTHHIVRRPKAETWAHLRPIFIGSHDLPVIKWNRGAMHRLDVVNDSLHFNVIALVPPPRHLAGLVSISGVGSSIATKDTSGSTLSGEEQVLSQ